MLLQGAVRNLQLMGKRTDRLISGMMMNSPGLARDVRVAVYNGDWQLLADMVSSKNFTLQQKTNILAVLEIRMLIDEQKEFLRLIIADKNDLPEQLAKIEKEDSENMRPALMFIYLSLKSENKLDLFYRQLMDSNLVANQFKKRVISEINTIHEHHCETVGTEPGNLFSEATVYQ
jgi:hypothetical protein